MGNYRIGKPRHVHNVVRKWAEDKQNANVVGRINNQTSTHGLTHEQKCVHMISKRAYTKNELNSYSCRQSVKKPMTKDKIKPLGFQKV
jgi:hypothetical protein